MYDLPSPLLGPLMVRDNLRSIVPTATAGSSGLRNWVKKLMETRAVRGSNETFKIEVQ
jgi:hypothetical protein